VTTAPAPFFAGLLRIRRTATRCPTCGGAAPSFQTASRSAQLQARHEVRYSAGPAERTTFLDGQREKGQSLIMGSYGHRAQRRVMAAAVEQFHDDGDHLAPSIAPYDAHVVALTGAYDIGGPRQRRSPLAGLYVLLAYPGCRTVREISRRRRLDRAPIRITAGKKASKTASVDRAEPCIGRRNAVSRFELGKGA